MKITQSEGFKPITIVLETASEAKALAEVVDLIRADQVSKEAFELALFLSNEFTENLTI